MIEFMLGFITGVAACLAYGIYRAWKDDQPSKWDGYDH